MTDPKIEENSKAGAGGKAAIKTSPAPTPARQKQTDGPKVAGKLLSIVIIFGAVALTLHVWSILERHPRTDDATVRANIVNIVPRVRGQIVKLCVEDNQAVNEGDLLFEIDPDDYKLALDKARADLAALDKQIEVARSQDAALKRCKGREGGRRRRESASESGDGHAASDGAAVAERVCHRGEVEQARDGRRGGHRWPCGG